jgi:4-amino-4-deoxy-L-arabinose transferase-like glycosyltransferase
MTSDQRPGFWTELPIVIAIIASVVIRTTVMAAGSGRFDDPDNYLPLAHSLAAGQGLALKGQPTAYRPPLYPLLLAPILKLAGAQAITAIALFHLVLGAAMVGMTALCARRWGFTPSRSIAAAWIVALDPVLAWQSRFVMTETLTAFLCASALAALTVPGWRGSVGGGVFLGLAGLSRPSMLPGAILVVVPGSMVHPGGLVDRLGRCGLMVLSLLLVSSPWAIRNALIFGEPVWTTTHGGYTLALANNEVYYRDVLNGPPGSVWTGHDQWLWWNSVERDTTGMSEPQADRFLRNRVVNLAFAQPLTFLRAGLHRLRRFWSLAPAGAVYPPVVRWATAAWTLPLWIALGLGLGRRSLWRWPQIAAPLLIAGLSLVHTLFWTDLRMRAPIVPAIALVAAGAHLPIPLWSGNRRRAAHGALAGSLRNAGTYDTTAES